MLCYPFSFFVLKTKLLTVHPVKKVNNARSQGKPDEIIPEATERGRSRIDQARRDMETSVNRFDRKVEDKTGESKGKLSGLFGK